MGNTQLDQDRGLQDIEKALRLAREAYTHEVEVARTDLMLPEAQRKPQEQLRLLGDMICLLQNILYAAQQAARRATVVPQGWKMAPDWKGYALLGTGNYVIHHSAVFNPELGAELVITLASDKDREGNRQIGESRPVENPNDPIQADDMVVRIGFLNERGLFALEDQLADIRKLHFSVAPQPPEVDHIPDAGEMVAKQGINHIKN